MLDKIKAKAILILKILIMAVLLLTVYFGIDYAFRELLSSTARAVLSNFIVFASVIAWVMLKVVHPKAMLEKEQDTIETQIKDSESAKEDSETRLNSIENSMNNIEKEIELIINTSEENAKLIGEKILQDGNKTALIIKENKEKALDNSRTLLKNDLLKKASLASVEVAKNHIINELTRNENLHDKLIEESIEAIEGVN